MMSLSKRSQGYTYTRSLFQAQHRGRLQNVVELDWAGKSGVLLRTGFIITLVALSRSTTEAELIALSTALREVIHLQNLLRELREHKIPIPFTKPIEVAQ